MNTKVYNPKFITATVPLHWDPENGQSALSVHVMIDNNEDPITAEEARYLLVTAARVQFGESVRDCGVDEVTFSPAKETLVAGLMTSSTLTLSLGT